MVNLIDCLFLDKRDAESGSNFAEKSPGLECIELFPLDGRQVGFPSSPKGWTQDHRACYHLPETTSNMEGMRE
jgi:hypothetical protein